MNTYIVCLRHDSGKYTLRLHADNLLGAIARAADSEHAPINAVISARLVKTGK